MKVLLAAQVISQAAPPKTTEALGRIPLYFEQNRGQAAGEVDYIARAAGRSVLISAARADMTVPSGIVRMSLEGANSVRPEALDPLRAQVNYLLGTNHDKWITHASTYQRVRYTGVYPGIDLIYHGTGTQLEYDFVIAPDADPSSIRLRIDGSQPIHLDAKAMPCCKPAIRRSTFARLRCIRRSTARDNLSKAVTALTPRTRFPSPSAPTTARARW